MVALFLDGLLLWLGLWVVWLMLESSTLSDRLSDHAAFQLARTCIVGLRFASLLPLRLILVLVGWLMSSPSTCRVPREDASQLSDAEGSLPFHQV